MREPVKDLIVRMAWQGIVLSVHRDTVHGIGPEGWGVRYGGALAERKAEIANYLRGRTYTLEELLEITAVRP